MRVRSVVAKRAPLRLSRRRERWVYAIGIGTWVSGALWLLFHYFVRAHGAFGDMPHPLESWSIKAHAAFALGAVWMCGVIWAAHVQPSWTQQARRVSGIALLAVLLVLVVSAYLLLYLGDENARAVVSIAHWSIGLALPAWVIVHVWSQRQRRRKAAGDA